VYRTTSLADPAGIHIRRNDPGPFRCEHEGIGSFGIFIVPLGRTARGVSYEAEFSCVDGCAATTDDARSGDHSRNR
jgi:hypothetical protein